MASLRSWPSYWVFPSAEKKRTDESDVSTGVNYGVASLSSWSKSIENSKIGITRMRASPQDYCLFEHLECVHSVPV
jgi:hypothetical protein